jgi:hypothetical protein
MLSVMPSGMVTLAGTAAGRKRSVEIVKARSNRGRRHEVGAGVFDQAFDLALVVALGRTRKVIGRQVVAQQFSERPHRLAFAVAADLRHRDLEVVIQDRQRHPTQGSKRRDMAVEECLGRLARIRLDETGIRLGQVHAEEVDLLAQAADHRDGFPEIHLCVSGQVKQRHENVPPARPADPHVILHHSVTTSAAVLVAQPFENPL